MLPAPVPEQQGHAWWKYADSWQWNLYGLVAAIAYVTTVVGWVLLLRRGTRSAKPLLVTSAVFWAVGVAWTFSDFI